LLTDLDFLSEELEASPRASVIQRGLGRNIAFLKFEFLIFINFDHQKNLGLNPDSSKRLRKGDKKKGRIEHGKEKYGLPLGAPD
jgi:hypothetical protein